MRISSIVILGLATALAVVVGIQLNAETTENIAQGTSKSEGQTETEFQKLMPITGTVQTYFGQYELDHSFPTKKTADKIYDLMDHQRASQLYLWSLPPADCGDDTDSAQPQGEH